MKPQEIAEKAKKSISKFCTKECKAYCCRKSYIVLNGKEVELIAAEMRKELKGKEIAKQMEGEKKFFLDLSDNNCPCLKDNMCMIHKNPKRPKICKQFPIFIKDKNIRFSPECLAVKNGLFYPYEHEFLKIGCKLS